MIEGQSPLHRSEFSMKNTSGGVTDTVSLVLPRKHGNLYAEEQIFWKADYRYFENNVLVLSQPKSSTGCGDAFIYSTSLNTRPDHYFNTVMSEWLFLVDGLSPYSNDWEDLIRDHLLNPDSHRLNVSGFNSETLGSFNVSRPDYFLHDILFYFVHSNEFMELTQLINQELSIELNFWETLIANTQVTSQLLEHIQHELWQKQIRYIGTILYCLGAFRKSCLDSLCLSLIDTEFFKLFYSKTSYNWNANGPFALMHSITITTPKIISGLFQQVSAYTKTTSNADVDQFQSEEEENTHMIDSNAPMDLAIEQVLNVEEIKGRGKNNITAQNLKMKKPGSLYAVLPHDYWYKYIPSLNESLLYLRLASISHGPKKVNEWVNQHALTTDGFSHEDASLGRANDRKTERGVHKDSAYQKAFSPLWHVIDIANDLFVDHPLDDRTAIVTASHTI